jgi:hypothetical protein
LRRKKPSEEASTRARRSTAGVATAAVALVALVALLAVTLSAIRGDGEGRRAFRGSAGSSSVAPSPPVVISGATSARPSIAGAHNAAARFLQGYVAFLYGANADKLEGASADLRRALRRSRVRVPPARAQRTPRLLRVDAVLQAPGVVQVTATIDDGDLTPYPVTVFVELRDARWQITHLADD